MSIILFFVLHYSSNSELASEDESGVAEDESDESWRESRRSRARRRREDADFSQFLFWD